MERGRTGWSRPPNRLFQSWATWGRLTILCLCLAWGATGPIQAASAKPPGSAPPLVIRGDPGGLLEERLTRIRRLQASGQRVELRSGECLSACTLYLGLSNLCVSPGVVFGFHGPSSVLRGLALPPDLFEKYSRLMAAHYPPPLRRWFLRVGRQRTLGFHRIDGGTLIGLGVPACTA